MGIIFKVSPGGDLEVDNILREKHLYRTPEKLLYRTPQRPLLAALQPLL